jgi:hypothetical protein
LFTTQTLGLNPEISKGADYWAFEWPFRYYSKQKKATHLFYGAGCGTERMKLDLSQAFQSYFTNAIVSVEEDTYAAVYATSQRPKKQFYSRNRL